MKPYTIRITRLTVLPEDDPIFSGFATHFTVDDEAAGEFIEVQQQSDSSDSKNQTIQISPDEWPKFKEAVDMLMAILRTENES